VGQGCLLLPPLVPPLLPLLLLLAEQMSPWSLPKAVPQEPLLLLLLQTQLGLPDVPEKAVVCPA
jgi:hypothetical protein